MSLFNQMIRGGPHYDECAKTEASGLGNYKPRTFEETIKNPWEDPHD